MRNKWIVVFKGDREDFELSVCLDNAHGVKSWGWPGEDKIVILDSDGLNSERLSRPIKARYLQRAQLICDALNAEG